MDVLSGLKFNTGALILLLTFAYQFFGLTKEDAESTVAAVGSIVGGALLVWGYVMRIVKWFKARKAAKNTATEPAKP